VRFPRVSVPAASFEALTDESAMSLYAVSTADGQGGMGVHTFCSYCGVHVVYAPSTDPQEIQVNVDCLDKTNIEQVLVSYLACADSTPVQLSYEPARSFNRRGTGSANPPQTEVQAHAQVCVWMVSHVFSMCRVLYVIHRLTSQLTLLPRPFLGAARSAHDPGHAQ
jgi:hypothetical protein